MFVVPNDVLREEARHTNNIQLFGVARMTVGPAFAPSLTPGEIAAKLVEQIHQLIGLGQLSETSPFVQDSLKFLNRLAAGEAASKEKFLTHLPSTSTEKDLGLVLNTDFTNAK